MSERSRQPSSPEIRARLIAASEVDARVRAELAADGSLFDGYHPRMEAVHRQNAGMLRVILSERGWPDESVAGPDGAEAAWRIAQHSIGEPAFMRLCRDRVEEASRAGRVPRWQFAYLEDRIRVFEQRPQRYGTQYELTPEGPRLEPLEDLAHVEAWRSEAGLGPLSTALDGAHAQPRPSAEAYRAKRAAGEAWSRRVGWIG